MATKTISIMDDVYDILSREKLPNESFSDTIRRIVVPRKSLMDFWGICDNDYCDDLKEIIKERREENKKREKWRESMFV